jgi:hypothetical protein
MTTNDNDSLVKISKHFECKICDYTTSRKFNLDLHNNSVKHKNNAFTTNDNEKLVKISKTSKIYECEICDKKFNDRAGLWRHKKKCSEGLANLKNDLANEEKQQQLVEYLLKENSEFKHMMLEQNKHMIELAKNAGHNSHNTANSHNTNTTNNSFNLQFYLNDTCKDAMNIMDFVSQLQVGVKDLEETGRLGFAEGISKIFINGLKQINVNDRPLHCSDSKRETLYIKSNNEWNKENDEKTILTNAIKHVAYKNMKQISEWAKDHPEYNDPDSRENDRYLQIVSEAMSGSTKEECCKNYNKIIKNIVKETIIDKGEIV